MENLEQYVGAYEETFPYSRDNQGVLKAYSKELVAACQNFGRDIDICSLGIGYEVVSRSIATHVADKIKSHTIVEGSSIIIERYKQNTTLPHNCNLIHDYFESFSPDHLFDVVEMGFVLEHVEDPELIVNRFSRFLKPEGVICAAVPNALSMHRVFGARAGLLKDLFALSEWDLQLGHKRYFDRQSFLDLFKRLGLEVTKEAGLMLKPFSTAQLNMLNLPDAVWDVLFDSGDLSSHYAYSLYAEVRVPSHKKPA